MTGSVNVPISTKQRDFILLFQSMRLTSDETIGAYMGIRRAGCPLYVKLKLERTLRLFVLAALDSFEGLSFAHREGSYHST